MPEQTLEQLVDCWTKGWIEPGRRRLFVERIAAAIQGRDEQRDKEHAEMLRTKYVTVEAAQEIADTAKALKTERDALLLQVDDLIRDHLNNAELEIEIDRLRAERVPGLKICESCSREVINLLEKRMRRILEVGREQEMESDDDEDVVDYGGTHCFHLMEIINILKGKKTCGIFDDFGVPQEPTEGVSKS